MSELDSLERDLRALRAMSAPRSLAANVLVQTGLADRFAPLATPLGPMYVAWNELGVSLVRPAKSATAFSSLVESELDRRAVAASLPADLEDVLKRRFAGDMRARVPVDLSARSPFERAVLEQAATIPRGVMKSYGWIAAHIGNPRAVRAVGTALGKNPVPMIIPCHRVIRNDGGIGNYIFGTPKKTRLLALEGALA